MKIDHRKVVLFAVWLLMLECAETIQTVTVAVQKDQNVVLECQPKKETKQVKTCFWSYNHLNRSGGGFVGSLIYPETQSQPFDRYFISMNYQTGNCQLKILTMQEIDQKSFNCGLFNSTQGPSGGQIFSNSFDVVIDSDPAKEIHMRYGNTEVLNGEILEEQYKNEIRLTCAAGRTRSGKPLKWNFSPSVNVTPDYNVQQDNQWLKTAFSTAKFALDKDINLREITATCNVMHIWFPTVILNSTSAKFVLEDNTKPTDSSEGFKKKIFGIFYIEEIVEKIKKESTEDQLVA